jgi:curved DNA-binding protein CbpA
MFKNFYELLGVKPNSTHAEIRSAYRKLVLQHHPDHSTDPKSPEILRLALEAYETLSEKERRKNYDAEIQLEEARRQARIRDQQSKTSRTFPQPDPQPRQKPSATRKPDPATSEMTRLTRLFNTGRFDDAERLAYEILAKDRKSPIPYVVLGDIARSRRDVSEAINMYARAVQAEPQNPIYQKRYEELVMASAEYQAAESEVASSRWYALFGGVAFCLCASAYIAISKEAPILPGIGLINSWTLGLMVMLFLCGVAAGVSLCVGGLLDRFGAVSTNALGKVSPAMALGTIAVVNFWVAAGLYGLLGLSQKSYNYSTTRLVGAVAAIVALAAAAGQLSWNRDGAQVLLWGGNLVYIGAICGWMVSDSVRND